MPWVLVAVIGWTLALVLLVTLLKLSKENDQISQRIIERMKREGLGEWDTDGE